MKASLTAIFRGGSILLAGMFTSVLSHAEETKETEKTLPTAILRKYDADHDGLLNDTEKAAWKADVQKGRAEAQAKKIEKYDANNDGKLDAAEKATAKSESSKKKADASAKKAERDKAKQLNSGASTQSEESVTPAASTGSKKKTSP